MGTPIRIFGSVSGGPEFAATLDGPAVAAVRARVRRGVHEQTHLLERLVVTDKLRGGVLNRRTGTLARSIASGTMFGPDGPEEFVGHVGTNVVYGRAWELGFTVPARVIYPKTAKALFWPGAAHPVRSVSQPARTVAARPWLRPALEERRGAFLAAMRRAVEEPL